MKNVVEGGDYASSGEVIREAIRDWTLKRALHLKEMEALRTDTDKGMRDIAESLSEIISHLYRAF